MKKDSVNDAAFEATILIDGGTKVYIGDFRESSFGNLFFKFSDDGTVGTWDFLQDFVGVNSGFGIN